MKHNGITLGARSPLLTPEGARRKLQPKEEDMQIALMEFLVGPARPGQPRDPAGGMIPRYPDLYLLHAIPNGGARSKRTAGRMRAQGALASMPDLCLPVMRGPFIGLYLELKVPGQRPKPGQSDMHTQLRMRGHAVVTRNNVEEAAATVIGYLDLPPTLPSTLGITGFSYPAGAPYEYERIAEWRRIAARVLEQFVEYHEIIPNTSHP